MADSIAAQAIHHVSFRVNDLDESISFYRDVLGCELLPRPDLGFPGAWLRAGQTEVHLLETPVTPHTGTAPDGLETPGAANHVAFRVSSLELAVSALRARGHEVKFGTVLPQAFVQDPSGNMLELTEGAAT